MSKYYVLAKRKNTKIIHHCDKILSEDELRGFANYVGASVVQVRVIGKPIAPENKEQP